jgi:CHAT domain-containing protein
VGFTQALLMSGARSVCLSLWKVDDTATALLMQRFYGNLLGRRPGLSTAMPKAEALREAKTWLRGLRRSELLAAATELAGGIERGKGAKVRQTGEVSIAGNGNGQPDAEAYLRGELRRLSDQTKYVDNDRPYAAPYYWAAFVLAGDPD